MLSFEKSIRVNLGARGYDIAIVSRQLERSAGLFEEWWCARDGMASSFSGFSPETGGIWAKERRTVEKPVALILTDENIAGTHAAAVRQSLTEGGWRCEVETLPAGEPSKSLDVVAHVFDRLVAMNADRRTVIVAVGGGVIGDVAGFVAATFMRGLPFIQVPTTLLAAVDSSVGGKTGVNHPQAKNLIGAFYQPIGVLIDTSTLETLPDREFRAGLAEVVKYGVILDADFFRYLEEHVHQINSRDPETLRRLIAECCRLKASVVERDEFEISGIRAALNYGHTFGHAFEALAGYGALLHGEAVAMGMVSASRLAERRGLIPAEITRRQVELLTALHLPTELPSGLNFAPWEVIGRMRLDKKSVAGKLRFILPTQLGNVKTISDIPESDVIEVLNNGWESALP